MDIRYYVVKNNLLTFFFSLFVFFSFFFSAPIIIGVGKIGEHNVVDFDEFEEACSSCILFIAVEPPATDLLTDSNFNVIKRNNLNFLI